VEAANAPPGPQHDLLGHVFGLAAIAQQAQQHREHAVGVRAGQLLERGRVPVPGPDDQFCLSFRDAPVVDDDGRRVGAVAGHRPSSGRCQRRGAISWFTESGPHDPGA